MLTLYANGMANSADPDQNAPRTNSADPDQTAPRTNSADPDQTAPRTISAALIRLLQGQSVQTLIRLLHEEQSQLQSLHKPICQNQDVFSLDEIVKNCPLKERHMSEIIHESFKILIQTTFYLEIKSA